MVGGNKLAMKISRGVNLRLDPGLTGGPGAGSGLCCGRAGQYWPTKVC